jgi:hypothetical protein
MRPRRPKTDPRLVELQPHGGDVRVDASSPRWLHRLVYEIARALQRDERYDFPQWSKDGAQAERDQTHAILFVEPEGIPIGATSFSWIEWANAPPGWRSRALPAPGAPDEAVGWIPGNL